MIYLGLLSSRNGNGPGLSLNAFDRLIQNFFYLPARVFGQHPIVLLTFLIGLFFALITIFKNPANHAVNLRQFFEIGNIKYLLVALASYLPIAIWYVSPRHTFLPILFFLIWFSKFFSEKIFPNIDLRGFWLPVGLIIAISFYMTTLSLNDTKIESNYRSKVYSIIKSNLGESEAARVCILISPKDENIRTFQHEYLNAALSFYSGNPRFIQYDCFNPRKFFEVNSAECLRNEVLQDVVFLRFIENLTSTILEPSFNSVSQCGIL